MNTENQPFQRSEKNPYSPPNGKALLESGQREENDFLDRLHQTILGFGAILFAISMVVPAIKYGEVIYGYECVFWGGILIFCSPPAGGAGRTASVLSFIGTLGNVAVFVSWIHFSRVIRLRRWIRIFASSILLMCLAILTVIAFNRRIFDAVYLGYWLWLASMCVSAVLLVVGEKMSGKKSES